MLSAPLAIYEGVDGPTLVRAPEALVVPVVGRPSGCLNHTERHTLAAMHRPGRGIAGSTGNPSDPGFSVSVEEGAATVPLLAARPLRQRS